MAGIATATAPATAHPREEPYIYKSPSAHATRAVLNNTSTSNMNTKTPAAADSTSADNTPTGDPTEKGGAAAAAFRPQVFRKKSTNYADAAEAAKKAEREEAEEESRRAGEGRAGGRGGGDGDGKGEVGVGVKKPGYGRVQSWNKEDLKRVQHVRHMKGGEGGFSET